MSLVRWYAVQALGTLGTSEVIVDIQRMLADPDAALDHSRTASVRFFRSAGFAAASTAKEKVA
jgi:HEAT repeat protein